MVRHESYIVTQPSTTEEGRAVAVERLRITDDEEARRKIIHGPGATRHFDILEKHLKALARAGEINDVDFPAVSYMRADGTAVVGLETDDAFMSGERPVGLWPYESTEFALAEWMLHKAEKWMKDGFYSPLSPEYQKLLEELTRISGGLDKASEETREEIKEHLRDASQGRDDFDNSLFEYSNGQNQLMNEYSVDRLSPVGESAVAELRSLFSSPIVPDSN